MGSENLLISLSQIPTLLLPLCLENQKTTSSNCHFPPKPSQNLGVTPCNFLESSGVIFLGMSLLYLHHFLGFTSRIPRPNPSFSGDSHPLISQQLPTKLGFFSPEKMVDHRLFAATVSGSGAEYSEGLISSKGKKKKRVAGIDQDELLDPTMLADPDSCFCEFKGVHIHHKICHDDEMVDYSFQEPSSSQLPHVSKKIMFPIILLHGFGASVFSWSRVMKPLAKAIHAKVLAFDRPAFGLTSRVNYFEDLSTGGPDNEHNKGLNPYSMAFSVLATLYFSEFLAAEKVILMGHSAGCLVAVNTYFKAPERVAALILVAPAIVTPRKVVGASEVTGEDEIEDGGSNSDDKRSPSISVLKILSNLFKYISHITLKMLKGMTDMISSLFRKVLLAFLRSSFAVVLIRMIIDKFSITAIRNAWYDSSQVTDHVLEGYTKPLRSKDWDRALIDYTVATLTESSSELEPPLARRFPEISCPVLIVTGDRDRIVPSWNAKRLSQAIPGSHLEVIKNCGHLPHEERVEEFLSAVQKFIQRVLRAPEAELVLKTA